MFTLGHRKTLLLVAAFVFTFNIANAAATRDRTKPTTPGNFCLVSKTAYTVTVAWNPSSDNSGNFNYHLAGAYHVTPAVLPKTAKSHTFTGLFPGNTTAPANPDDETPPTIPEPAYAFSWGDGSTESQLSWTQSTDDFDAQAHIRYDVYVNGVFEDVRFGSGGPLTFYGQFGDNIIEVFATDTAGNTSEPAVVSLFIP